MQIVMQFKEDSVKMAGNDDMVYTVISLKGQIRPTSKELLVAPSPPVVASAVMSTSVSGLGASEAAPCCLPIPSQLPKPENKPLPCLAPIEVSDVCSASCALRFLAELCKEAPTSSAACEKASDIKKWFWQGDGFQFEVKWVGCFITAESRVHILVIKVNVAADPSPRHVDYSMVLPL